MTKSIKPDWHLVTSITLALLGFAAVGYAAWVKVTVGEMLKSYIPVERYDREWKQHVEWHTEQVKEAKSSVDAARRDMADLSKTVNNIDSRVAVCLNEQSNLSMKIDRLYDMLLKKLSVISDIRELKTQVTVGKTTP